jgi:flagella basal body P-ring formation protein FlgA
MKLIFLFAPLFAWATCHTTPVGDVATHWPVWGAKRELRGGECVQRPSRTLDRQMVLSLLAKHEPEAIIAALADTSSFQIPDGTLELAGIQRQSTGSFSHLILLRVRYEANSTVPIRVPASLLWTVRTFKANRNLIASTVLTEADWRVEENQVAQKATSLSIDADFQLTGQTLRRSLLAGELFRPTDLLPAAKVKRGGKLQIQIKTSSAAFAFDAVAMADSRGDRVAVSFLNGKTRIVRLISPELGVIELD